MKVFGPKNFKFHAGVKKCHFGNYLEWAGMAVPCYCSHQESLTGIRICVPFILGSYESLERLKGKIGEAPGPIF